MKRFLAVLVLATAVAASAFAQPKAVGGRFGYSGLEASYQHYLGAPNFIEANLGADFTGGWGFKASALYNYVIAQPNWTSRGDWSIYAGVGLSTGYVWDRGNVEKATVNNTTYKDYKRYGMGFMFSVPVQGGLSYTFWFPLQVSVDVRPYFGMQTSKQTYYASQTQTVQGERHTGFYNQGMWGFLPTVSVHYAF